MELWEVRLREPGGSDLLVKTLKKAGLSKKDHDDLDDRITPYASYPQSLPLDVWALLGYVADGAFSMDRRAPYAHHKSVDSIKVISRASEGGHHVYLKKLATRWLKKEQKIKNVVYEQPYYGGIADVSSPDGIWSVECGCSRPDKIWETFRHTRAADHKVVLFSDMGVTIFTAGKNIREYIEKEGAHRAEIMRRIGDGMSSLLKGARQD